MIVQASVDVRNGMIDSVENTIGTIPTLEIREGAIPASTATADTGTLLGTMTLASDWMLDAGSGQKLKSGDFKVDSAVATGTASYWRVIRDGGGCDLQGDITGLAGDGSMKLQNVNVVTSQSIVLSSFTMVAGNS